MGRRLVESCGLLITISFALPLAYAGDNKSSTREHHELKGNVFGSHETHAISVSSTVRTERSSTSLASPFEGRYAPDHQLSGEEKENASAKTTAHKSLTLFQLDSKLGELKFQPVLGKVTGAQFSLGF